MLSLLHALLSAGPTFLPAIMALIASGLYFRRFRKPALLMIAAALLLWLNALYSLSVDLALGAGLIGSRDPNLELFILVDGAITQSLTMGGYALLICAAFVGRAASRTCGRQPREAQAKELVLMGSIALLLFQPLGIVAWMVGAQDLRAMRVHGADQSSRGTTTLGMVLGIVSVSLFGLTLIAAGLTVRFVMVAG
ncbi:hypothetical protein B5T_00134 [Alloalcanivorax dieselolei B5]|uniref:DUF4190 domain-containing protein n=1 Tax=Alcanivorax dieselolei (strain DSM 16502 / CGMCC 1.3690 / MCCC 1A00001 / B-5) TaxID=930169 RepID=K0C9M5_ALCDB|nr:hypothetical protein [Alloalcanivorax dieselolei]AFT68422.1 hypothetical protein B5T_00134 [Alloalcanivorax dieselolei B5]GGJ99797.1 hypothetical protein GCM10007426_31170 [Alloalcanivorax dieselolei]